MSGNLVILSGPSGVGKDTVIEQWKAFNPAVRRVVAATTRDPRPGEVNGVDYHFLQPDEFEAMIEAGEFLEHKLVHGRRYGTPKKGVDELLAQGLTAILKIDVEGAQEVLRQGVPCCAIFLMPPSMDELERRIRQRATDTPDSISLRLNNARAEIMRAEIYHHKVVNNDLAECVRRVDMIVRNGCE